MSSVLRDARMVLGMTQHDFGYAVGASLRTAARWDAQQSVPVKHHWTKLAELLAPLDLALAAEAAEHGEETLESLGLAPPPPPPPPEPPPPPPEPEPPPASPEPPPPEPPPPPPPPAVAPEHLVDAVVCAVAEFLDTSPRTLRPLLYTAFKKARQVGLSVEDAEKALAPAPTAPHDHGSNAPAVTVDASGGTEGETLDKGK